MSELGIREALTLDHHFTVAGFVAAGIRLTDAVGVILTAVGGLFKREGWEPVQECPWRRSFEQLRVSAGAHEVDRTARARRIIDLINQ